MAELTSTDATSADDQETCCERQACEPAAHGDAASDRRDRYAAAAARGRRSRRAAGAAARRRGHHRRAGRGLRRRASTPTTSATSCPTPRVLASLGCGNPTAVADLHEGETVLDLGSGGGIDVLLSARRVGPTGKAYGLDMTDEMLELARANQREAGVENVEFAQGPHRGRSRSPTTPSTS